MIEWSEIKKFLKEEIESCKEQCCYRDLQELDRIYIIGRKEAFENLLKFEVER